jgi:hypothetical protein
MLRSIASSSFVLAFSFLVAPAHADSTIFFSGGYSSTINDWNIGGYVMANNFTIGAQGITGASFVVWMTPGDVLTSVQWAVTTLPGGGTTLASGTASPTQTLLITPSIYGYDIDNETFNIPQFFPGAGTYWLQLGNAVNTFSGPSCPTLPSAPCIVGWDENDDPLNQGLSAYFSGVGGLLNGTSDPSDCTGVSCTETFTIVGTPEPGGFALLAAALIGTLALLLKREGSRKAS